jgi:glycosyltransferase involved in cell wall biosynthesis
MKLLITHPGRQHSHQAALALERAGMLAGYWSGVPALERQMRRTPAPLRRYFARYEPVPLNPETARWFPWTPALRRLADALLPRSEAARVDLFACRLFDHWAARNLPRGSLDGVIACEISALSTFRAARRLGLSTILDAPSIHHSAQDRLHGTGDPRSVHARITHIKDLEVDLADQILTVSELARETYIAAGIPAQRVHAVALGADLDLFKPGSRDGLHRNFQFLFCGATIYRKGFDLLLEAFDRVASEWPQAQLKIIGPRGDAAGELKGRRLEQIVVTGPLNQAELVGELQRADCFVLPSRNDSFGMVVAEALACGLPVLVSTMVGASQLVEPDRNGWIVPAGDVAALADRMAWCVRNPALVESLRPFCRESALSSTWPQYHERLSNLLRQLLPGRTTA